jgi:hypothetical protein
VAPAKTANRALAAPALRHIVGQTVLLLDKKLHQILEMMRRNRQLDKCNANFGVGPPHRTARAASSVEHDIKTRGEPIRRGNLQARARIRNISNGTIKLWRFVAEDDLRGLQYALAGGHSIFLHG